MGTRVPPRVTAATIAATAQPLLALLCLPPLSPNTLTSAGAPPSCSLVTPNWHRYVVPASASASPHAGCTLTATASPSLLSQCLVKYPPVSGRCGAQLAERVSEEITKIRENKTGISERIPLKGCSAKQLCPRQEQGQNRAREGTCLGAVGLGLPDCICHGMYILLCKMHTHAHAFQNTSRIIFCISSGVPAPGTSPAPRVPHATRSAWARTFRPLPTVPNLSSHVGPAPRRSKPRISQPQTPSHEGPAAHPVPRASPHPTLVLAARQHPQQSNSTRPAESELVLGEQLNNSVTFYFRI